MWDGATGRGGVWSASLWHEEGSGGVGYGLAEWITFPVHKVNVSNSRVTEGIKHLALEHVHETTAFNPVESFEPH